MKFAIGHWSLVIGCLLTAIVQAENIDLSTVPERDTVQLTIYNSEDITLVRETRKVTFKTGVNPLQFSWANTLIDPSSVELKFLSHPDKLDVLDTTFPHDKPQILYWNVQSEIDGEATIQITGPKPQVASSRSGAHTFHGLPAGQYRVQVQVLYAVIGRRESGEATVDVAAIIARGLAPRNAKLLKVLGEGDLARKLTVESHRFSSSAKEKIEKAGGTVKELPC